MHREQNGIKGIIWTGIETRGKEKEPREERRGEERTGGSTTIVFKDLKRCCMEEGLVYFMSSWRTDIVPNSMEISGRETFVSA